MKIPPEQAKINRQKILNAFPENLREDVEIVFDFLSNKKFDIHSYGQDIILDGQHLSIPGRISFDASKLDSHIGMTDMQHVIMSCICLRHNDGFVRQKHLEMLVNKKEYFITPYIFQLFGEYVIEIMEQAEKHINENTIDNYFKFFKENPEYRRLTECRMISYWDRFYRRNGYKRLKDYSGYKIFQRLK